MSDQNDKIKNNVHLHLLHHDLLSYKLNLFVNILNLKRFFGAYLFLRGSKPQIIHTSGFLSLFVKETPIVI